MPRPRRVPASAESSGDGCQLDSQGIGYSLAGVAVTALLTTCDGPYTSTFDQTWFVRYLVSNKSSVDVVLKWGSEFSYSPSTPIDVPSGTTREVRYYEEFLGPPPDAGRTFTCISVHRASDDVLVYQLTPVRNRQWSYRELSDYHVEYTLIVTDAMLDLDGQPNRCATLTGTVVDSLTTVGLDRCHVGFRKDSVCCSMHTCTTDGAEYLLMWPGDIPVGTVWFSRTGYRSREIRVPDAISDLGDRHYRLDVVLSPETAP